MGTETAIVTGYSSGLGYAFTESLLAKGWSVIGIARTDRAQVAEHDAARLHHVSGSVAHDKTADEAFRVAQDQGGARLLVNCAGLGVFGEVGEYSAADIWAAAEGNLLGLMLFTDRGVAHMKEIGGGTIVNVMSTASKKYRPTESVYTGVKWGAKAYTRTVREAVKSQKLPIRLIEVYPCGMQTHFWQTAVRPATDGSSFPTPGPIAKDVLAAVFAEQSSYQQELTFERS